MDILNTTNLKHAKLLSKADSIEQSYIYQTEPIIKDTNLEHIIKDIYLEANTIDINLDTKIYRIFPFKWLLNALKTNTLYFVKPEVWPDPYENFLLRSKGVLKDGTKVCLENLKNQIVAQCWSTKAECDGLWRTYSPKHDIERSIDDIAVKVETTVRKLFEKFYDMSNPFHSITYYVGRVQYVSDDELKRFFTDDFLRDGQNIVTTITLLLKRTAFSYEEEVRFIYNGSESIDEKGKSFPIQLNNIIDKITIEPWVTKEEEVCVRDTLNKYYQGNIVKDNLYDDIQSSITISM